MNHKQARDTKLDYKIYNLMNKIVHDFKELEPSDAAMVVEAWSELIHKYTEQKILEAQLEELLRHSYGKGEVSAYSINQRIKELKAQLAKIKEGK